LNTPLRGYSSPAGGSHRRHRRSPPTTHDCSWTEEIVQSLVGFFRRFLGEEVAAIEGVAAHIVGPVTPDGERVVPRRHDPPPAPEGQKRAGDPARPLIGGVVFAIEGGGGAVLLADGVDGRGIAEGPQIFGAHRRGEGPRHGRPTIEHVVEDELRLGPDQALGDWMRRGEEGPDPVVEREGGVGATMSRTASLPTASG